MSTLKNNGKTEKLVFIINNMYYISESPKFIDYATKKHNRKDMETLRNYGKNNIKHKDKLHHYFLLHSLGKTYQHFEEMLREKECKDPAYYFITINPPLNSVRNFKEMDDILQQFYKCKYVQNNLEYCIEQRNNIICKDDLSDKNYKYDGIHAHLILLKTCKPSKVKTDLIRIFKSSRIKLPPFINGKNFITFPKGDYLNEKRRYIRGDKGNDLIKLEKVEVDQMIREHEGLPSVFTSLYM